MSQLDTIAFDLFLEERVAMWRRWADQGPPSTDTICALPTFLGMSPEEYGSWFLGRLDDRSYRRLDRVWKFTHNRSEKGGS